MRGIAASAIALAACGRVGFDPPGGGSNQGDGGGSAPDASLVCSSSHDEDGDGIDDCADTCPHLVGAQTDTDGDGIGDLCDTGIGSQQRIAVWVSFAGGHGLTETGTWEQLADSVRNTGAGAQLALDLPIRDSEVWVGATIENLSGGSEPRLALALDPGNAMPHFLGEVFGPMAGMPYIAVSGFDGSTVMPIRQAFLASFPASGDIDFRIGMRAGPQQMAAFIAPQALNAFGNVPGYTGSPRVAVQIANIRLQVRYLLVIEAMF